MKLKLNNIAMIKEAEIKIDGLTVLAGKNGTGKSTISKTLFAIFNSFSHYEDEIKKARLKQFANEIQKKAYSLNFPVELLDYTSIARSIIANPQKYTNDENLNHLIKQFTDYNFDSVDEDGHPIYSSVEIQIDPEFTKAVKEAFEIYNKMSDENVYSFLLNRRISSEFRSQVNNVNSDEKGAIELTIKEKTVSIEITNNIVSSIKDYFSLNTEALYLDNPFVLDDINILPRRTIRYNYSANHQVHLSSMLLKVNVESEVENAVRELAITDKINRVLNKINIVCSGELTTSNASILYKSPKNNTVFRLANVSAGLKTFIIIKTLLLNGTLEENGTLILDEPEIHLHPEWQIIFAEIIVLLQKEFNMHILINTHSPYFVEAIEVFVEKYGIKDKTNFYLSELNNNESVFKNVTKETEKIYKQLAAPFQTLENLRWSEDD